jgi:septum formation protein
VAQPIILASQSPRRKQLLEWAEIPFEIIIKSTDESYPATLPIDEIPVHIALNKALAVQQYIAATSHLQENNQCILAADTVVVLDDIIIGKPIDRQAAIDTLKAISGRQHSVITGVVILKNDTTVAFVDITKVWFNELTEEQIIFYVDKYKPYDKAGAYAIQEWIGVVGIKSIEGDFYNVMGLPVSRVVRALQQLERKADNAAVKG